MDDVVSSDEILARYLYNKGTYNKTNAKSGAFMPQEGQDAISVYRTSEMSDAEVHQLGIDLGLMRSRSYRARADLLAGKVSEIGLETAPDTKPHPNHAHIVGWPDARDAKLMKAVDLANIANLVLV